MVIPCVVVLIGVIIGWYTVSGSDIHIRPYGREHYHGESPLDDGFDMGQWSRGTQSSRRRKH